MKHENSVSAINIPTIKFHIVPIYFILIIMVKHWGAFITTLFEYTAYSILCSLKDYTLKKRLVHVLRCTLPHINRVGGSIG